MQIRSSGAAPDTLHYCFTSIAVISAWPLQRITQGPKRSLKLTTEFRHNREVMCWGLSKNITISPVSKNRQKAHPRPRDVDSEAWVHPLWPAELSDDSGSPSRLIIRCQQVADLGLMLTVTITRKTGPPRATKINAANNAAALYCLFRDAFPDQLHGPSVLQLGTEIAQLQPPSVVIPSTASETDNVLLPLSV